MVALSITPSQVQPASGIAPKRAIAGEAIGQGEAIYVTGGTAYLAEAGDTAAKADAKGIALNAAAAAGQPIEYQGNGASVTLGAGASMTIGVTYYLGETAGTLVPLADLTTGSYAVPVGVATSASVLAVQINSSGATVQ